MDNAIHIEVEVVYGGDVFATGAETPVEYVWVLVCEPAEHFGDTVEGRGRVDRANRDMLDWSAVCSWHGG